MYDEKAQSAIEYLMTYGWMLIVVSVVGGGIYSVIGDQRIESTSGFNGNAVSVENFGVSRLGSLDMVVRNTAADKVRIKNISLSQGDKRFETVANEYVDVGDSVKVSSLGAMESSGSNTVDVEITYDSGNLENQVVRGSVTGNLEVGKTGKAEVKYPSNWVYVDVSEVSQDLVDTSSMEDFYVMQYEASPSDAEPDGDLTGSNGTYSVGAASQKGVSAWNDINQVDARTACQASGYDLITNRQWQAATMAEIGNPDTWPDGNNGYDGTALDGDVDPTNTNYVLTGTGPRSWSNELGIYDLNGNFWEMTNDSFDQTSSGYYVSGGNSGGDGDASSWNPDIAAPDSLGNSDSGFGDDNYWKDEDMTDGDVRVIRRGGKWNDMSGAGVYSMYTETGQFADIQSVGFRCSLR